VYVPYVVTLLNKIPMVLWYVARFVLKNEHQQDTCHNEIGLCVRSIDTPFMLDNFKLQHMERPLLLLITYVPPC
jgi:hypothetical protein